jgi:predicted ATPase
VPWTGPFHELSHGEAFLALLGRRASAGGLFLLDEPDAALSFTGSLSLVVQLTDLLGPGGQQKDPVPRALRKLRPRPDGAEVGPWGLRGAAWEDLELTASYRQFLRDPQAFLRHLC